MDEETVGLDPIAKLAREVRATAAKLERPEAAHLVFTYYRWQEHRIALANQVRSLQQAGRPVEVLAHFFRQAHELEKQTQATLGEWAASRTEGAWALAQKGIGPVLAAGLSAHIDIRRAETAGAIWRFAGLDPTLDWLGKEKATQLVAEFVPERKPVTHEAVELIAKRVNRRPANIYAMAGKKGEFSWDGVSEPPQVTRAELIAALAKRPYNADLKVLCWKIGASFVKVSGRDDAYYGWVYRERKALEVERDAQRAFADQAAESLATRRIQDPKLKQIYESGHLPPGRLDLRARRYAEKLFLSHWHHVAYEAEHGKPPPLPYPIAHLGHVHMLEPPPG